MGCLGKADQAAAKTAASSAITIKHTQIYICPPPYLSLYRCFSRLTLCFSSVSQIHVYFLSPLSPLSPFLSLFCILLFLSATVSVSVPPLHCCPRSRPTQVQTEGGRKGGRPGAQEDEKTSGVTTAAGTISVAVVAAAAAAAFSFFLRALFFLAALLFL